MELKPHKYTPATSSGRMRHFMLIVLHCPASFVGVSSCRPSFRPPCRPPSPLSKWPFFLQLLVLETLQWFQFLYEILVSQLVYWIPAMIKDFPRKYPCFMRVSPLGRQTSRRNILHDYAAQHQRMQRGRTLWKR